MVITGGSLGFLHRAMPPVLRKRPRNWGAGGSAILSSSRPLRRLRPQPTGYRLSIEAEALVLEQRQFS
jgi:hypothetical protein